jgi:glycosyltransferase involved in cell wall biosynthesis
MKQKEKSVPLISVIVPVYNAQHYLGECLDSIINQTFKDIEIICVNDGATDSSVKILTEYARKDPRITIISQKNKGPATARNVGLKASKGKYISFVDSDDRIDAKTFASAISFLEDGLDLVIFQVNVFGEHKSMQKYFRTSFQGKLNMCGDIIVNSQVSSCNKIYKKDIIDKYKISFPDGLFYEDNAFHWKYLMHARNAYFLPEKFYNYRIRKNSTMDMTKSRLLNVSDHFWVCLEIFEYMKKYNLLEKYSSSFVEFFRHCLGIVCANSDNLLKSLELANDIWSKINIATKNSIICALRDKNYDYVTNWMGYGFVEKLFSIKKRRGEKVLTICGMQYRWKILD